MIESVTLQPGQEQLGDGGLGERRMGFVALHPG